MSETNTTHEEMIPHIKAGRADAECIMAAIGTLALFTHQCADLLDGMVRVAAHEKAHPELKPFTIGIDGVLGWARTLAEARKLVGDAIELLGDAQNNHDCASTFGIEVSTPVFEATSARAKGEFVYELGE
jgi:hypothetical protein